MTSEFLRLQSHYLFQEHFCLVRRANEKDHVENLVGFTRRNYLVPAPQVDSLASLNEELLKRCSADLDRRYIAASDGLNLQPTRHQFSYACIQVAFGVPRRRKLQENVRFLQRIRVAAENSG